MRHPTIVLLLAGLLLTVSAAVAAPDPPQEQFDYTINVALDTIVVRVVDSAGRPILGLLPDDFRITVHKREIPVTAVDWVSSDSEAKAPEVEREFEGWKPAEPPARPPGKLVVFFVQADLNPTRISGQLRLRPYTRELVASLAPADRVAVVSFDSHLKLWLDFTTDRQAVLEAVDRAMVYTPEADVLRSAPPSLAARFDFAEALRVASPERALEMTAKALNPLPGEKTMIYLGWGLGRFGFGGVRMTPDFRPAVAALANARVSVFVLDVTSADSHSLEVGLEGVAAATGGTYASTFRLPGLATHQLARSISGWYELTVDRDDFAGFEPGEATIELRHRKGEVLARPVFLH
jgi:VWFA-related protein